MNRKIAYFIGLAWMFTVTMYVVFLWDAKDILLIKGVTASSLIVYLLVFLISEPLIVAVQKKKYEMRKMSLSELSSHFQDIQHTEHKSIVDYAERLLKKKSNEVDPRDYYERE